MTAIIIQDGVAIDAVAIVKVTEKIGHIESWKYFAVREDGTRVAYLSNYGFIGTVEFPDEDAVLELPKMPEEVVVLRNATPSAYTHALRPWEPGYKDEGE